MPGSTSISVQDPSALKMLTLTVALSALSMAPRTNLIYIHIYIYWGLYKENGKETGNYNSIKGPLVIILGV